MLKLWLVWRQMISGKRFLGLTTYLSLFGMALGVASLVIAMSVVSGYETTLRNTVIDIVGHILVLKDGSPISDSKSLSKQIKNSSEHIVASTPFVVLEAVLARKKKVSGVVIEGIESSSVHQVLKLKNRLKAGSFTLGEENGVPRALVGKGIAQRFSLKPGDKFRVAMPMPSHLDLEKFRPRVQKFIVSGVLDLGRHDYDHRYILTELKTAQEFGNLSDKVNGLRVRVKEDFQAEKISENLNRELGFPFRTKWWFDVNRNLFEAVQIEKPTIFFVILVMVIAACFNISSTLFVSVMRRFSDISILKTMGADRKFILRLFTFQGVFLGFLGALLGLLLGIGGSYLFVWAHTQWNILPAEVYKLDHLDVELRWFDLSIIFVVSLLVCYISTIAPARRGSKLLPIEGLRYE